MIPTEYFTWQHFELMLFKPLFNIHPVKWLISSDTKKSSCLGEKAENTDPEYALKVQLDAMELISITLYGYYTVYTLLVYKSSRSLGLEFMF